MTKTNVRGGGGGRKWKVRKGSGAIRTWDTGVTAEGRFHGWKPGKFGDLLVLETAEGVETFASAAILKDRLQGVQEDTLVYIECLGKTKVKAGEAWNFEVKEAVDDDVDEDDDDVVR